ncbi:MAG: antibiotic biosynthesis monooxygenase [Bacteroidota bacterium]
MIIRIFKAVVPTEQHQEFEEKFKAISVPVVENSKGIISLDIGKPTTWNPKEFVMVSRWESEQDLIDFAGTSWNQAHIPNGMEKYIESCTVDHFYSI